MIAICWPGAFGARKCLPALTTAATRRRAAQHKPTHATPAEIRVEEHHRGRSQYHLRSRTSMPKSVLIRFLNVIALPSVPSWLR